MTLVVDGMRSVRSFHFDKSAASVLTTCMCICDEGYLFLGSRLGNSLLLKYTEKTSDLIEPKVEQEKKGSELFYKHDEPPSKKKKKTVDGSTDMASDVSQIENLYELEVYGSAENPAGTTITSCTFEVCDNIWNIAPCGNIVMGEPAFLSEEFVGQDDPDLELVTTSGYGKNGAISVLQRSIRPQVVTTFELPGCLDMWTVRGINNDTKSNDEVKKEEKLSEGDEEKETKVEIENGHSFLILSREDSSMILQTGQDIMELDHSGFSTQTPTIFAGNIGDNKYIVQVSTAGVRLLQGVTQLQHIPIDVGSPLIHCSLSDPYIVLLSQDGQIVLLTLKPDFASNVRLVIHRPSIPQYSKIIALCTYRDVSGVFTTTTSHEEEDVIAEQKATKSAIDKAFNLDTSNIDDEDEMLYGDTDTSVFSSSFDTSIKADQSTKSTKKIKDVKPTYWVLISRDNGVLEIFTLPDLKLCYFVKNFPMGSKILVDSVQQTEKLSTGSISGSFSDRSEKSADMPVLKEILMVGLGYRNARPYLMARVEDDFYIYEAYPYYQSNIDNHLKIRFKKFQHNLIMRDRKTGKTKKRGEEEDKEDILKEGRCNKLRYFDDVAGYSGVFVCGQYPHLDIYDNKRSLRIHSMSIDGPVTSFSQFHNVNCPKGFLYFNRQGELRISVLPTHVTYDAPWPVRKVPLRCTPHFVSYHPDSKTYAVVTSTPELCDKLPKTTSEEREWDSVQKDERFVYPSLMQYSVQLFSPSSWEMVPNTRIELQEWEQVTMMKCLNLLSEETLRGYKYYLVVATNIVLGEEVTSRGRIIYEKEQKGPVTALAQVEGFLVTAIGQKCQIE
ncbi:hypothetical protein KUTeg_019003 [Tegillarca granosa]|uniref:Cleavage and polyadenylation specificity factor subunit 1 n=1 Tax=Tegillarca granosa TaxID=220873 RepID=A0ABQ9EGA1_TEGGR|nr:hypothetical protein KUTeg_019003 [Tegillarca granosa]